MRVAKLADCVNVPLPVIPPLAANVGMAAGCIVDSIILLISTGDRETVYVIGATLPMSGVPKATGVSDKLKLYDPMVGSDGTGMFTSGKVGAGKFTPGMEMGGMAVGKSIWRVVSTRGVWVGCGLAVAGGAVGHGVFVLPGAGLGVVLGVVDGVGDGGSVPAGVGDGVRDGVTDGGVIQGIVAGGVSVGVPVGTGVGHGTPLIGQAGGNSPPLTEILPKCTCDHR